MSEKVKPLDIILDLGNQNLRGMIFGNPKSVVVVEHALKKITPAKFDEMRGRMKRGAGRGVEGRDVSIFQNMKGNDCYISMVGKMASGLGAESKRIGGKKYLPDYYPQLFLAVMLRLFPQGHENIRVMSAFPPSDVRFRETIMDSLGGKHAVILPTGDTIVYKVREVYTYDEPVGGLMNYIVAEDGKHYRKDIPQGRGLCVDIGGGFTGLVPFYANGEVDYLSAKSVPLGIQDVMRLMSDILLNTYPQHFAGQRGALPMDEVMRECLVSGIYEMGGEPLAALDAIADATSNFRNQVKEVYELELGGARPYKFVTVTGGGGGLLFAQLVEHVLNFNASKVHPSCDDMEKMYLSNLFGGHKMFASMKHKGTIE